MRAILQRVPFLVWLGLWVACMVGASAAGQEVQPPVTTLPPVMAATVSIDPWSQLIAALLNVAQSTPGGVAALLGGLYLGGPRLMGRLGIGTDPGVIATLARHDERSRETRREVRKLRINLHWQANVLTALALRAGITIPAAPIDTGTDEDDSDENKPTVPAI